MQPTVESVIMYMDGLEVEYVYVDHRLVSIITRIIAQNFVISIVTLN